MRGSMLRAYRVQSGLTLMELMVVIAILALLAGYGTLLLVERVEMTAADAVASDVLTLSYAAQAYAANQQGNWPDAAGLCQNALQKLRDEGYLAGPFASPWLWVSPQASYATDCPLDSKQHQNTFLIDAHVPVNLVGAMQHRLTSVTQVSATADWALIRHHLPLPRFHSGSVKVEQAQVSQQSGQAQGSAPACAMPTYSAQPLDICLDPTIQPVEVCEDVEEFKGYNGIGQAIVETRSVCVQAPLGVRGYYTETAINPMDGSLIAKLFTSADGTNYQQISVCDGQPVAFSIMEFCQ
jgi:prepilin-type N-terminal cleavage/methylation domain-containing protein